MGDPSSYSVDLDDLVAGVRVPLDQQVEQEDVSRQPEHDEGAGHLPGGVRPYGA